MTASRLRRWSMVRSAPALVAVIAVGLVVRAVLIPITHGQDFAVWDMAATATLHGVNVYADHPHYPGGPYAYFPLFLDVELPFQWLAGHIGVPFTVLGKLPIAAADVAVALLISAQLRHHGLGQRVAALGAASFFLNPLVIYNSAFYGRFDSLGCALLLWALRQVGRSSKVSAWTYALAVAAKTFPVFLLMAVLRRSRNNRGRVVIALLCVLGVLSLPYLGSLKAYTHDIFVYDLQKIPQGMSWQRLLLDVTDSDEARLIGYLLLGVFAAGAIWLSRVTTLDRCAGLTLVLFLLCSKVVLEQYLLWPLPWLALAIWTSSRRTARASLVTLVVFTCVGMLTNESTHPWGRSPWLADIAIAGTCVMYLIVAIPQDYAAVNSHRALSRG